jgi:dUTPase
MFTFKKLKGISSKVYAVGDRVGQLIVMPIEQAQIRIVHELSESERGEGGFGSTGV